MRHPPDRSPQSDPFSDDPAGPGVDDELQDLVGRADERRRSGKEGNHSEAGCGGKLPPDDPNADLLDDLDL